MAPASPIHASRRTHRFAVQGTFLVTGLCTDWYGKGSFSSLFSVFGLSVGRWRRGPPRPLPIPPRVSSAVFAVETRLCLPPAGRSKLLMVFTACDAGKYFAPHPTPRSPPPQSCSFLLPCPLSSLSCGPCSVRSPGCEVGRLPCRRHPLLTHWTHLRSVVVLRYVPTEVVSHVPTGGVILPSAQATLCRRWEDTSRHRLCCLLRLLLPPKAKGPGPKAQGRRRKCVASPLKSLKALRL